MSLTGADIPSPSLAWTFNGTLNASAGGVAMTGTPAYITGLYGQAATVSTSQYTTGTLPAASNITTSNGLSVCVWSQIVSGAGPSFQGSNKINIFNLISSIVSGINSNPYELFIGFFNGWKISYFYNDPGFGFRETDSTTIANVGAWYHFCVVFGGSANKTITFYINGSTYGSPVSYTTDMSGTTAFNSVSAQVATNNTYAVSDTRIFPFALTATQVQTIYRQNGNPSLGSAKLYKSPGYTTPINLFSVGTPASGSVLAYAYQFGGNGIAANPRCVGFDAGSNVYLNLTISTNLIPTSLSQKPTQYPLYFSAAQNALIKYNKNGTVMGGSQIMNITAPVVNSIKSDPQSNVYMLVSGVLGTSTLFTINATNPRTTGATGQAGVTNVIKYGPDGSLISWGGFPIVAGFTATLYSLALDAGSNVYICGYYQSTSSVVGITNIANPPVLSASSLPITGVYFWPVILKWSSTGTFSGYSIIRCTAAATAVVTQIQLSQALCPDTSGNIYWGGTYGSNLYCNVNTISTTEPTSNIYSLNTTKAAGTAVTTGSNAFVIQFGPTGTVNKFTELGYGPAASASGYTVVRGIALSSTGNVYISGSFSTNAAAGVKLNNFGLVDPRTGSFLTQSGVTLIATQTGGNQILMCYNSSGTALAASQSQVAFSSSGGAVVVDKNDNIYQAVTRGGQQFTIQNLGQTSSSLVTGLNTAGTTNSTVIKYNAAGAAIGFSDLFSSSVNYPSDALAANNDGVFCVNSFTQAIGSAPLANVAAITTTTGAYVYTLPSTYGVAATLLIKWAL